MILGGKCSHAFWNIKMIQRQCDDTLHFNSIQLNWLIIKLQTLFQKEDICNDNNFDEIALFS